MRKHRVGLIAFIASVSAPALATAQDTSPQDNSGETGQIADIIVTAQRREESAQSVPISLQSFSADTLREKAIAQTEDLTTVVGGLMVLPTAARPMIFLRGVGTNSSNTTPAILTFIDGVYQPFGQSTDLVNIASLEVLKGPQGTLFGRNATGGVLQITTKPPSETPGARVEIGYGNYETVETTAYVTGGLAPGVAMDASVRYLNQGEGFGTNIFNGDDVYKTKKFSARSRLRAEVSETTTFTLTGDYSQFSSTLGTAIVPAVGYGYVFAEGARQVRGGPLYPGSFDINAGPLTPIARAKEWGVSLTAETQLGDVTAKSITAYRNSNERARIDSDGGPSSVVNLSIHRSPRTAFTQELQFISGSGSPLSWSAGLFYYNSKATMRPFQINAAQAFSKDTDESIAAYAQGTYEVLPDTNLTLGGRYTIEKRTISGYVVAGGIEVPGRRGDLEQKFKEPTWRVALDHKLLPEVMVYGSVSRGFNAGFFNQSSLSGFANTTQNPEVKPEFLTAYEVGMKADLFDRHVRVNLSGFQYDYKSIQQQIVEASATITVNAGDARIRGVDFEVIVQPVRSLSLSVSGTYLDTKVVKYDRAPNYVAQANGGVIVVGSVDAKGNHIINAPNWSYTASLTHDFDTSIGKFATSADVNYRGKMWIDFGNQFAVPTRYVVNATERWTSNDGSLFASVWVKNLLDKRYDYSAAILPPTGIVGQAAPPRTYGATVGFQF